MVQGINGAYSPYNQYCAPDMSQQYLNYAAQPAVFAQPQMSDQYGGAHGGGKKKASLFGAIKSLVKGATVNFIKAATSPKGLLMAAGGIALTVATGGAALPFLIAGGVAMSGVQVAKNGAAAYSLYKQGNVDGAEKALENVGTGITSGVLSVAGARAAVKGGVVKPTAQIQNTGKVTTWQAVKSVNQSVKGSVTNALQSAKSAVSGVKASAASGPAATAQAAKAATQAQISGVKAAYTKGVGELKTTWQLGKEAAASGKAPQAAPTGAEAATQATGKLAGAKAQAAKVQGQVTQGIENLGGFGKVVNELYPGTLQTGVAVAGKQEAPIIVNPGY